MHGAVGLETSSGNLSFLAEKVLEFFHGLSFFRLEFFGYREKKKPGLNRSILLEFHRNSP